MNQKSITEAEDKDIAGSLEALRRAARRAREIAAQTGTAIIVQRGGQIERITYPDQRVGLDDSKAPPDLTDQAIARERPRTAAEIFDLLASFSEDFMADGRNDQPPQEREKL